MNGQIIDGLFHCQKKQANLQKKKKNVIKKKELLENSKKSEVYKKVLKIFPDAELIDIDINREKNDD